MDWSNILKILKKIGEFIGKKVLPVLGALFAVAAIWYAFVRIIDWSSVSAASDATLPAVVVCNTNTNISGDTMTASKTRRPTILEDWVKARSALVVDTRAKAEEEANESVEDYLDDIDCPEACPNRNPVGAVSYTTSNTPVTGSKGFGYIRYDVSASSKASAVFICEAASS